MKQWEEEGVGGGKPDKVIKTEERDTLTKYNKTQVYSIR